MMQAAHDVLDDEPAHAFCIKPFGQIGRDSGVVLVDLHEAMENVLNLLGLAQARGGLLDGGKRIDAAQPAFAEVRGDLAHARVHLPAVVHEPDLRVDVAEALVERVLEVQLGGFREPY